MNQAQPLFGKRIVVTRTVEQSRDLKDRLENLGAVVMLLPAVSFSEPADTAQLDDAIQAIESYDWLLFTSANAVRFFAGRCRKLGMDLGTSCRPRCAAVGPATATVAAAEELCGCPRGDGISGYCAGSRAERSACWEACFVAPRSDRAGRDLPEALKSGNANVTEIVAYRTGGLGAADLGRVDGDAGVSRGCCFVF